MYLTKWYALLLALLVECPMHCFGDFNITFLEKVLGRIGRTQNYTTAPIFVGRHLRYDDLTRVIIWLQREAVVTNFIFFSDEVPEYLKVDSLRNYISDNIVTLIFVSNADEVIWWHIKHRMQKLRQTKVVVIIPQEDGVTDKDMNVIFKKLWAHQFLNVIVLYRGQIYRYTPYPKLKVFCILDDEAELFPPLERNFRGYLVETPAENDIPRVFFVQDEHTGKSHARGFGYRIFSQFLERHNATLRISNTDFHHPIDTSVNMNNITLLIGHRKLEISMHPYTGIDANLGILSYPLLKALNCLIVPVRNEIPRSMYLLRPFRWNCYCLLLVAALYIGFMLYWVIPETRPHSDHSRFQHCTIALLESLAQLMFLSSTRRNYRPSWRYFAVALQLAVLGFFITNWYTNLLSSFLTTFLVGEQVNSFEQLIDAKLPILAKDYERNMLLQQVPPRLRQEIDRLIVGVNASVQVSHLLSFNRSFSYPFTVERWQFFALQQQYANKPIYRYSSICFGAPVIGYPMRTNSHFEEPLKQFIMDIQMAGLLDYWLVSDFKDAIKAGYVRHIDNELPFKALDMDTLYLAWCILACGWLLAALAFYGEHWWYRKMN